MSTVGEIRRGISVASSGNARSKGHALEDWSELSI